MATELRSVALPPVAAAEAPAQVEAPKRPERRQSKMRRAFWAACGCLGAFIAFKAFSEPPERWLGAALICAASLWPIFLWISGRVTGLPIFPLYAVTFIWIYGLPLISDHLLVVLFPASSQIIAAVSVAGFLMIGTATWYFASSKSIRRPRACWMFDEHRSGTTLIMLLGGAFAGSLVITLGWVTLSPGVYSIVRALLMSTEALTCFVLSFLLSQTQLSRTQRWLYFLFVGGIMVINLTSLLLITSMSLLGLVVFAYVVGCRTVPWRLCLVAICAFSLLHYGKAAMREKYWREDDTLSISPSQYPEFFVEWVQTSWKILTRGAEDEQPQSLVQRASLMHLLLYVQMLTPESLPFLDGESYAVIPLQFVPRLFYPEKPRSHVGTYILTKYYNLQTEEDTELTTIDFGLINEAYANFGFVGMGLLAVVLGGFFAATANWARQMPILSFRALFAVVVAGSILQSSSSASFYVTTLYQSLVALFVVSLLVMRSRRPHPQRNLFLE